MRIPGLGCLKGCLFTLVLLFVAGWLVWELTPLQDWIAQGKSYWEAIGDAVSSVERLDLRDRRQHPTRVPEPVRVPVPARVSRSRSPTTGDHSVDLSTSAG